MADKDFVVKNGLVVNSTLIIANSDSSKVGINVVPDATLTVGGAANVQGVATVTGNGVFNANVYVGNYANIVGNANVGGTLGVTGVATFSVSAKVGANLEANSTAIFVGNTTVNTTVNSSSIILKSQDSTVTITASSLAISGTQKFISNSVFLANVEFGNSTFLVGLRANSSYGLPGQSLLTNGTSIYWSTPPVGANSIGGTGGLQYYNGTDIYYPSGASPALIFNDTTNSLSVGNSVIIGGATVNSTYYTGTSANSAKLGGVEAVYYVNSTGNYTITGIHTYKANLVANGVLSVANAISLNGSNGTGGYVLTSAGDNNVYWSAPVNVAAQYAWTNTHVFSNTITANSITLSNSIIAGNNISVAKILLANSYEGQAGMVLTSAGSASNTYWKNPINSNTNAGGGGVQFHNGTTFGATTGLTFSAASNNLTVGNTITLNGVTINSTSFPGTATNATKLNGVEPTSYVNVTDNYTFTGVHTHNANIVIGTSAKLFAQGSYGATNQVLTVTSTGGVQWTNPAAVGVTSVSGGNGFTACTITSTGTFTVKAGNGISVDTNGVRVVAGNSSIISNSTGVYVGSMYYNDLIGKPTIFDGAYGSLTGRPTLFDGAYASLTGRPTLSTVATSGSYVDLTNKPTIPDTASFVTTTSLTTNLLNYAPKASPTFSGTATTAGLKINGAYSLITTTMGPYSGGAALTLSCSSSNYFILSTTGSLNITFGTPPSGMYSMVVKITGGGSGVITWASSPKWPGAVAPTPSINTDFWIFTTDDAGATWRGNLSLRDYR